MPVSDVVWQMVIILLLILVNGVFAMSEIAVVSSRKARLKARADEGDARARRALELAEHPNRFLGTVQIGITLVGILAGAYGGATIAVEADAWLAASVPALAPYSRQLALVGVVLCITYLSLVLGELVPKRIGLTDPERIASGIAGPMHIMSLVAAPVVRVLSASTDAVLRVLRVPGRRGPPVTEEEIALLLEVGTKAGVFEEEEQDLVERVFWLADQRSGALLTPRNRIAWLDINDPDEALRTTIMGHRHARFLVCDGSVDRVVGMVHVSDVLSQVLARKPLELSALMKTPLYIPVTMPAMRLLELFRRSGVHLAVVVDEYGGTEGLVTLADVLDEIVADVGATDEPGIHPREDGSWLVAGNMSMDEVRDALGLDERRDDDRGEYRTLGGFIVHRFGHLPRPGEHLTAFGHRFEVVDMDGRRVDQVMITRLADAVPERAD